MYRCSEVPFDPAHCLPVHGTDDQVTELRAKTEERHKGEEDAKVARAAAKKDKAAKKKSWSAAARGGDDISI